MKHSSLAFAGLVLALLVAAPGAQAQDLPEGVTAEMVQEGQQIYMGAGICAVCHGQDATGAVGPDLTDGEWLNGEGTYEQIVERVLKGVAAADVKNAMGAIMPPKGGSAITDEQVKAVAAYVWTLSHGGT